MNLGPDFKKTLIGKRVPTPPHVSRGLGDTIAKITTAIGIKPCAGCKERQEALNKLVPYQADGA